MNREWWKNLKTQSKIKSYVRPFFFLQNVPFQRIILSNSESWISDSRYVQCEFVVPDGIKTKLATFLQIFKKICIWNNRYRILFGTYATENEILIHPQ